MLFNSGYAGFGSQFSNIHGQVRWRNILQAKSMKVAPEAESVNSSKIGFSCVIVWNLRREEFNDSHHSRCYRSPVGWGL